MIYLLSLLFGTTLAAVNCRDVITGDAKCNGGETYDKAHCQKLCTDHQEDLETSKCVYKAECGVDIDAAPGLCMIKCKSMYGCDSNNKRTHDETNCVADPECFQYLSTKIVSDGSLDTEWADFLKSDNKDKLLEGHPATCKAKHKIKRDMTGTSYGICKCATKSEGQNGFGLFDDSGTCECANTFQMDKYDALNGAASCSKTTKEERAYPGRRNIYLNAACNGVSNKEGEEHSVKINCDKATNDLDFTQYQGKGCTGDKMNTTSVAAGGVIGEMEDVSDGMHCGHQMSGNDKLWFMVDQNCGITVDGPPDELKADPAGNCKKGVDDAQNKALMSVCEAGAIADKCCADGMFKCGQGWLTTQMFKKEADGKYMNCVNAYADYTLCETPKKECADLTDDEKAAHGSCTDNNDASDVTRTYCQPKALTPSPTASSAGRNLAFFGLTLLGLLM